MTASPVTVMIVEDDCIVALELRKHIQDFGYSVVGPFATIAETMTQLSKGLPDHAFLDVNLKGGIVFPIADLLSEKGVPFTFVASNADQVRDHGYQQAVIDKPFAGRAVKLHLNDLIPD